MKVVSSLRVLGVAMLLASSAAFAAGSDPKLGSDDSDFVKKAAKGGIAEVELGRLALKKALSQDVKAFASMMIKDHSKANRELATLAASKGVDLPTSKSIGEDVTAVHLKMLSGKSFDEAYIKAMVDDHKGDVADFQKVADSSSNPDVKKFAAKTLPTLQKHLSRIEAIQSGSGM